jgi:hypothetical protein
MQRATDEAAGGAKSVDAEREEGDESTLQSQDGDEVDGTGAFWELVQKSAEKDKLMEMVLGEEKDELMELILNSNGEQE